MSTLWHGRFAAGPAEALMAYTASISFDRRLWRDDATNAWLDERLPSVASGSLTPFAVADELLARSADLLARRGTGA